MLENRDDVYYMSSKRNQFHFQTDQALMVWLEIPNVFRNYSDMYTTNNHLYKRVKKATEDTVGQFSSFHVFLVSFL